MGEHNYFSVFLVYILRNFKGYFDLFLEDWEKVKWIEFDDLEMKWILWREWYVFFKDKLSDYNV